VITGGVVSAETISILKALSELFPETKTLPDESVATRNGRSSVFPAPSPAL